MKLWLATFVTALALISPVQGAPGNDCKNYTGDPPGKGIVNQPPQGHHARCKATLPITPPAPPQPQPPQDVILPPPSEPVAEQGQGMPPPKVKKEKPKEEPKIRIPLKPEQNPPTWSPTEEHVVALGTILVMCLCGLVGGILPTVCFFKWLI